MGTQCLRKTPYKCYSSYLEIENPILLKEQWAPIKIFKLKKIFQAHAEPSEGFQEKTISFEAFIDMLPQLSEGRYSGYQQRHKQRLFQLFDREGAGRIGWSSFIRGYSLCEYGSPLTLAVLMFALFDDHLRLKLTRDQLEEMITLNSKYLREDCSEQIDEEKAIAGLLGDQQTLSVQAWLQRAQDFFQLQKFRRVFTVWAEQEVERELAQRFSELNELYDEQKKKHVGYLISYKWFQSWKTYVHKEYGLVVNGFSTNLTYNRTSKTLKTIKSLRTKKTIRSTHTIRTSKSIHSLKSLRKAADYPRLREIAYQQAEGEHITQFNLVYGNIGDRPSQIYNNLLEGEYSEILTPELVENIHYVIVSEEVWRRLKLVYGAYPQFRRTGQKSIQIYPKNFKIYTRFLRGRIDFDTERDCEFSNAMPLDSLLAKALDLHPKRLATLRAYFKTTSMNRWEPIPALALRTADLTSQQVVFLAVVPIEQERQFQTVNCSPAENVAQLHVGDEFVYVDPSEKVQRRAVLIGHSRGRPIVHFRGCSYIYDKCVDRQTFIHNALLPRRGGESRLRVRVQQVGLAGLPNAKGLGFVNSVLLSVFSCQELARLLSTFYHDQPRDLLQHLACLAHTLSNGYHVQSIAVADLVRRYFYQFANFEFTMCESFIQEFLQQLHQQFGAHNFVSFENPVSDFLIQIEQSYQCSHCGEGPTHAASIFSLLLPLPPEEAKYYELVWVPFAFSLRAVEWRRYAFTLPPKATFKDYREAFERIAELKNVHYLLAEIHGNNIIKNYLNAKDQATLEDLLLREDDVIYAYELCFRLDTFVADHYSPDPPRLKHLKLGQMVDFQKDRPNKQHPVTSSRKKVVIGKEASKEGAKQGKEGKEGKEKQGKEGKEGKEGRPWTFGKIRSIDIEPYTHKWVMEVQYRQNRVQVVSCVVNPEKTSIAAFPTRSFLYADQYHLRVLNRVHNQVSGQMELCNLPLVLMVASWMRLRQVELLLYQQVRQLIADPYKFKVADDGSLMEEGQQRLSKRDKMRKFKQYLTHSKPYRIVFTDLEGRCALCCKIQKALVPPSEQDFACPGCTLDPDTPLFWQLRPYQARLCVDWYSLDSFTKPTIAEHPSYTATKAARKNSVQSVDQCLKERARVLGEDEECCCSFIGVKQMICEERVRNVPERLLLMFDRLVEEEENYKRINRKYVHFEMDEMEFSGETYQLVAATSIQGSQVDARYMTYIREKGQWLQYNGEHVKAVKKNVVQKICALLLQYKRIIKNDRRMAAMRE